MYTTRAQMFAMQKCLIRLEILSPLFHFSKSYASGMEEGQGCMPPFFAFMLQSAVFLILCSGTKKNTSEDQPQALPP